jgi:hypothetical protein
MDMNTSDAIAAFAPFGPDEKAAFLALLAQELTILARDTYEVGGAGLVDPSRMRTINEIQHRVTSFLAALLRKEPGRCPDEVLVQIILEPSGDAVLQRQLQDAFRRALSFTAAEV